MAFKTVPAAGQYGLIADSLPQELPVNAWSAAQNMRFRDGYAERHRGSASVFTTPSVTPYFLTPYRTTAARYWVHCGLAKTYVDDGATRTDITNVVAPTGGIDDRWTGGVASGVLILNNGVDQPQFWGGNPAVKCANLTGWNSAWRAACVRPFKNYVVALDVTKSGTRYASMVKWSAASVPGAIPTSWDETDATKDAGEVDLAETPDFVLDQLPLGDINVIYKERSMYGMQFVGQPSIWRFFRLPGEVGLMARGCVVNTPKGHVVLTPEDLVLHNGQGPTSIINARMRRWLFNSIDTTNYARTFLCVNQALNEVWVCFPEAGQSTCTQALTWNWQDDTFGVRQLPNVTYGAPGAVTIGSNATWASDAGTWASDSTSWSNDGTGASDTRLLMSSALPSIQLMEAGTTFNTVDPTCSLERTGLTFDTPEMVKTVKSVIPRFDAVAGTVLSIQIGGSMDAEVSPMWSTPVSYTVGTTRKLDSFATGRFLSFRITSSSGGQWRLKSFDMEIEQRGMY